MVIYLSQGKKKEKKIEGKKKSQSIKYMSNFGRRNYNPGMYTYNEITALLLSFNFAFFLQLFHPACAGKIILKHALLYSVLSFYFLGKEAVVFTMEKNPRLSNLQKKF